MTKFSDKSSLNYQKAGVNIDAANSLVERIKPLAQDTHNQQVLGGLGGFGALFEFQATRFKQPVLVSSTDGVGTKLRLAITSGRHSTIGIDLVAMCVNDLIVCGAEPLFFLDYFAAGALDVDQAEQIISGIAKGCKLAETALIGGETAEMPGMYAQGDYDLAGFAVGVVEKQQIIDGNAITENDTIIGIASSGPHSNGFSLIRKIIETRNISLETKVSERSLIDLLIEPTKIYVKTIKLLQQNLQIKAIAHITGGGLLENIPRILPSNYQAEINTNNWQIPEIFNWLRQTGDISWQEMYRTFNCGIGMIIIVNQQHANVALQLLQQQNENAFIIGSTKSREPSDPAIVIK